MDVFCFKWIIWALRDIIKFRVALFFINGFKFRIWFHKSVLFLFWDRELACSFATLEWVILPTFLADQDELILTRENLDVNNLLLVHSHDLHVFKCEWDSMLPIDVIRCVIKILHVDTILFPEKLIKFQFF